MGRIREEYSKWDRLIREQNTFYNETGYIAKKTKMLERRFENVGGLNGPLLVFIAKEVYRMEERNVTPIFMADNLTEDEVVRLKQAIDDICDKNGYVYDSRIYTSV